MRYLLTFWICLILISGYCASVSAQEAAQPATQEAAAKKKKEFEDFSKSLKTVKVTKAFLGFTRKKKISIAKYNRPN